MKRQRRIFRAVATTMATASAIGALSAAGWMTGSVAFGATGPNGECLINAVVAEDVTRSYSDANLADAKGQIQDAVQSFVGSAYPVTLGITSFGQIAPLPSAPSMLNVEVSSQSGADQLKQHVEGFEFDADMSGYTNWQAGLRDAFEKAKDQGADTVVFVTDGVPNVYTDAEGNDVGVGGWGRFDPEAARAAGAVADEIRAAGMHLETIFIRTDRPGFHGLDDPLYPTPDDQVEQAMQSLQEGWSMDRVITIAELADEMRARAAAACTPSLTLTKSHGDVEDVNGNGLVDAGDRVVFAFTGRNEGDLPLSGVYVTDPLLEDLGVPLVEDGFVGDLARGDEYRVESLPYTLTEQDMINCGFVNKASVRGDSIKGWIESWDEDSVQVDTRPGVSISKEAGTVQDTNGNKVRGDAGDSIIWNVTLTNTGNVPWTDAVVVDETLDRAGLALIPERAWDGSLRAGESIRFASDPYVLTVDDETAGEARNTVFVSAPSVCGTPLEATADAVAKTTTAPEPTPTPEEPAPSETPSTPAAPAEEQKPRAFTGNPLAGEDISWLVFLGVGGLSIVVMIAMARARRREQEEREGR